MEATVTGLQLEITKMKSAQNDMAADAVSVLDELKIERAHVIGASMGGMISQVIAYEHPARAQSLVSIMSTTWAPHLPAPGKAQQDGISDMNESSDDEAARLEQMGLYTSALPNQVTAILNAGDRTERVAQITASTSTAYVDGACMVDTRPPSIAAA